MRKEEVINSLELEDYLNNFINDGDNSLQEKNKMSIFLNEFMDKKLFVVEFITDNKLYIRVENEDDEILSDEFYLGEIVYKNETIEDFDLIENSDMTINKYVNNVLEDEKISAEDKIFMIKDFLKYLNKGYFRQDATDKNGNMLQLVLDQQTNKIIDKIYY